MFSSLLQFSSLFSLLSLGKSNSRQNAVTHKRETRNRATQIIDRYVRTRRRGSIQHQFATRSVANSVRRHRSRGHVEIRVDRQSTSRLAGAVRGETFHAPILRAGGERVHEQSRVRDETEDAFTVRVTAAAGGGGGGGRRVDGIRSRKGRVRKRECKESFRSGERAISDACTIIKLFSLFRTLYLDEL